MRKQQRGRVVPAIPLALTRKGTAGKKVASPPVASGAAAASEGLARGVSEDGEVKKEQQFGESVAAVESTAEHVPAVKLEERQTEGEAQVTRPQTSGTDASKVSTTGSMSNGSSPDPTLRDDSGQQPALQTNGQFTGNGNATANATPTSKTPAERFDMRQIRTELPPAFVPSGGQYTPQSTSSATHSHPPRSGVSLAHLTHPSTSNIVFGGHDSSASSPAPPQSSTSPFPAPLPTGQVPFYTHSHHASEPYSQRVQQASQPPPPVPWAMRQANGSAHAPLGNMRFSYPPRENFTPAASAQPNGTGRMSRSASHASSAAQDEPRSGIELQSPFGFDHRLDSAKGMFSEPKTAYPGPLRHFPTHSHHHHISQAPSNFPHPDMATNMDNAESIRNHVASQFQNPELADCHIQFVEHGGEGRQYLDGHKIVLARSSKLLDAIRNSEAPTPVTLKTQVQVLLTGRYVRVGPLMDSIQYLYGGPLPPFELYKLGPDATSEERVELALQYVATGAWLNLHAIAARGVDIAAAHLQLDTLEAALAFALDGGLGSMWSIDDGSEEKSSTCSSDDSSSKPEAGGSPTYDPFSSALLTRVIDFTVHNLAPDFYLDPAAPQSTASPRLPTDRPKHQNKPSRSDPRLSKIRFGEVPVEDHQRPSFATTVMSSIFLSLPFPLLKYLLEHPALTARLGAETVSSIMRQVVGEREVRRTKAQKARTVGSGYDNTEGALVHNLYWEESVEPSHQHRAGFRLARKRRGIFTPSSSGPGSERVKEE